MTKTIEDQKKEFGDLTIAAEALLRQMEEELRKKENESEENVAALEELLDQVTKDKHGNIGGRLPLRDSGERSARAKLKSLRSQAETALSFAKCLGIDVHSLVLRDSETGKKSVLELGNSDNRSSSVHIDLPKANALYGAVAPDSEASVDSDSMLR